MPYNKRKVTNKMAQPFFYISRWEIVNKTIALILADPEYQEWARTHHRKRVHEQDGEINGWIDRLARRARYREVSGANRTVYYRERMRRLRLEMKDKETI